MSGLTTLTGYGQGEIEIDDSLAPMKTPTTTTDTKKSDWYTNILKFLDLSTNVADVVEDLFSAFGKTSETATEAEKLAVQQQLLVLQQQEAEKQAATQAKKQQTTILIAAGVCVVAIVLTLLLTRK